MSNLFHKLLLIYICTFFSACYLDNGGSSSNGPSFEADIAPLLSTSCATSGCHNATDLAAGLNLTLDEMTIASDVFDNIDGAGLINSVLPEESVLLTQASNSDPDDPHVGGEVFGTGSSEYDQILDWISQGALNDDCNNVTHGFATDVEPALSTCATSGCHASGESISFGVGEAFATIDSSGFVDTGNPQGSRLLENALGNLEHPGGVIFTSSNDNDYRTIFCWIKVDQAIEN